MLVGLMISDNFVAVFCILDDTLTALFLSKRNRQIWYDYFISVIMINVLKKKVSDTCDLI